LITINFLYPIFTFSLEDEKLKAEEAIQRIKDTGASFSAEESRDIRNTFNTIELEMFDDAFRHSRNGGTTILDVLNIDLLAQHILNRNFSGPLRAILAFCPFHLLSSRMEKRNKEALENNDLGNQRVGVFPLEQFSQIYTQKEKVQKTIETLTRVEVTQIFEENFDKGVEAGSLKVEDKEKYLAVFLKNLGFKEGVDIVEIAPKDQEFYQAIMDTTKSAEETAKEISKGTSKRYHKWD